MTFIIVLLFFRLINCFDMLKNDINSNYRYILIMHKFNYPFIIYTFHNY